MDVAGVDVGEVGALHHQDVGDAFDRINPRLRASRAFVSVPVGQKRILRAISNDSLATATGVPALPTGEVIQSRGEDPCIAASERQIVGIS